MNEPTVVPTSPSAVGRPPGLTILCILSYINGGVTIFFTMPIIFISESLEWYYWDIIRQVKEMWQTAPNDDLHALQEEIIEIAESIVYNIQLMSISTLLLAVLSMLGVYQMWNLRKQGFWFYLVAQILWTILPFIFIGNNILSWISVSIGAVFTFVFVALYAIYLKYMK